jgi:flagellar biosynthesis protein FlhG
MDGTVKYMLGTSPLGLESHFAQAHSPSARTDKARVRQVWSVGGGKGGIGKSLIASSLAIALARMGNKVIAIDMDLGGANLHTTLGIDLPRQTLNDFLKKRVSNLESCVVETTIPRLGLISGAQDAIGIANLPTQQMSDLLNNSRTLDADYVIFDLGAGTSYNTLDFFLASEIGIVTLLPEPTSIENGYRFIKSAYFRALHNCPHLSDIRPLVEAAMDPKNDLNIKSPSELFRETSRTYPELALRLKKEIENFQPKLIMNQARTQTDIDIGSSVKTVSKKYFGIEMDYLGFLEYDSSVWQAVRRKRPLMIEFPNSKLVSAIEKIAENLISRYGERRNGADFR